ncbi:ATP-binding protein [Propionibacteriaceae bacterium Y2011]
MSTDPTALPEPVDGTSRTRGLRAWLMAPVRTVRGRILTVMLLVTAIALVGSGAISYLVARNEADRTATAALQQEIAEFRATVDVALEQRRDVVTGPEDVLRVAIRAVYPDANEGVLGIVDGEVVLVPASGSDLQMSLQNDQEFIGIASAARPGESLAIRHVSTAVHPSLIYVSVPVQVEGDPSLGHYVVAIDLSVVIGGINRDYLVYTIVGASVLVLAGFAGYQAAGRLLAPLRSLRRTAQRITDTDLSDRIPADQLESGDEVADLGRVMNQMLDRLSTSFDTQRRLLDDVGHELRTPLTIMRGNIELVDPHDITEVIDTRELVLEELDRMDRMVDDLLVLAKSGRPDFIRPAPVSLADLLSGVMDLIHTLGSRQWRIESETDTIITVDRQRIVQAMLQLVANAVRFTADGDVIAIGGEVDTDHKREVRIWVRDEGTGIAADQQDAIFERFHRGGSLDSHPHGAGLGLSIVTAIAEGHDGRVDLESTPGQGSTFTLCLPAGSGSAIVEPTADRPDRPDRSTEE